MMASSNAELLEKYVLGILTAEERSELERRLHDPAQQEEITALMEADFITNRYEADDNPARLSQIHAWLDERLTAEQSPVQTGLRRLYRYAAAAAILISIGIAGWLLWQRDKNEAVTKIETIRPDSTVLVTLSLAGGQLVNLDSASGGEISLYEKASLSRDKEWLTYEPSGQQAMHTLRTPYGKQFRVVLSDGTKVWLNATSSLRYPATFDGTSREVELQGEGYFEVAHNPGKPFFVRAGEATVRVLGTHFNVKGYEGETAVATLLEGSVQLNRSVLLPGEQGQVYQRDSVNISKANLSQTIAWKEGVFRFENQQLPVILREIARWYRLDIHYTTTIHQRFTTTLPRTATLARVLEVLEMTGAVKFKKEGHTITVLPPV